MKNKISVLKDRTICWLMQIAGIVIALASLLIVAGGIGNASKKETVTAIDITMPIFFLFVAFLGILLFFRGRKIHALLADFRLYASILAVNEEKSVEKIASATNQPLDVVMKKANAMCRRHYFTGHLDYSEKRLVFESDASSAVVRCPGCGAKALVDASGVHCAYCGSPLTVQTK